MPQIALRYIIAGLIATAGFASVIMSGLTGNQADMHIEPAQGLATVGETFTVEVIVEAATAVNVFGGEVRFNPELLEVESIEYNTSIADLWAEKPWYANGDGTINFAGGTTSPGGFIGRGSLITIHFKTLGVGETKLGVEGARILQHNGLGTDAEVVESIDAIYTIKDDMTGTKTVTNKSVTGPTFRVLPEIPNTDLNNDGQQTVADLSIFMTHLITQNERSDFNQDGKVDTIDLSILTSK